MLQKSNTPIVSTTPPTTPPSALTESIAKYVLASEPIKKFSDDIAMVQKEWTPAGKLDILETESRECRKLASPTTFAERCLNYIGSSSLRQTILLTRAAALDNDEAQARKKNEELKLSAAVVVETLYQKLFAFNPCLQYALGVLKSAIAVRESRTDDTGGKLDWQATWLDEGARAFFHLSGAAVDAHGRLPYELDSLIRSGQRLILDYDPSGEAGSILRILGDILADASALGCLSDAAIVSVDGQISFSCGTSADAVQGAARDLIDTVELHRTTALKLDYETAIEHLYGKPSDFADIARSAIKQIENTENEVRRSITRAVFPNVEGLALLRDLYPAERARELAKARRLLSPS